MNNAGITKDGLIDAHERSPVGRRADRELKSAFNFIHAVTPIMARQKAARSST